MEEVSRHTSIQAVPWFLLATFIWVYSENLGAKGRAERFARLGILPENKHMKIPFFWSKCVYCYHHCLWTSYSLVFQCKLTALTHQGAFRPQLLGLSSYQVL
jgi:hypothetical protein